MHPIVIFQFFARAQPPVARLAVKRLFSGVQPLMFDQIPTRRVRLAARVALVQSLARVKRPAVNVQSDRRQVVLAAVFAHVRSGDAVISGHVTSQHQQLVELLAANGATPVGAVGVFVQMYCQRQF
jgi:phosphotransacetylase